MTVERIVSERPYGMIFAGKIVEPGIAVEPVSVLANFDRLLGLPAPGDTWEIVGTIASTSYGRQLTAASGHRVMPSGRMISRFVAEHVPGIGTERADRLWRAFGANLAEILCDEGAIDDISAVLAPERPLLAKRLAVMAVSAWRAAAGEASLVEWLARQGVDDVAVARRLHRVLGDGAVERLASNPYTMVPLLSWHRLDPIGRRLLREDGANPAKDVRRITGAADEVVKRMLRRGDTATPVSAFGAEMRTLLGGAADEAQWLRMASLNGAVLLAGDLVRAPGAAGLEDDLVAKLHALIEAGAPPPPMSASGWSDVISQVEDFSRPLSPDQRAAVAAILSRPVACLAGGAGTGKTATCKVVCDLTVRRGGEVVLCALAGKAALRLSRSTGRLARTLARTLAELSERDELEGDLDGADPEDPDTAKQRAKLEGLCRLTPRTLLVLDESSMIDVPIMHAVTRRLPPGGRVLMVGDEAQLPPVGFGLAYHRFVSDRSITQRLHRIHRQAAETGIPVAAQLIREGRTPTLAAYHGRTDGIFMFDAPGREIAAAIDGLCAEFGDEGLVVTSTLGGPAGVRQVNERRHAVAAGTDAVVTRGFFGLRFGVGEPVIYGRNDYKLGLFNGLFGRVTATAPDERTVDVLFDGDKEPKRLGVEQLVDLDHAYAVTCHKCQGSSAPRVIVPIYPNRLLDRSWIYTAVTRGERQVVLVGDPTVLEEAVARLAAADLRRSGLRWPA
ncbi:AAA family ATPase [Bradyrhizobium sp. F1.13.3]|uniref:AAA family ATPase n=1 Tax=Bradyrhizobium sp. F1.13.3 TaxID=3156351 RepID=UPI0033986394